MKATLSLLLFASGLIAQEQLTPAELRGKVEALQAKDVPWRRIPWKSCLLEGLAESRKTKRPLMLWIFIDRPIDDARC